jgi:hypothetical protein
MYLQFNIKIANPLISTTEIKVRIANRQRQSKKKNLLLIRTAKRKYIIISPRTLNFGKHQNIFLPNI